VNAVIGGVGIVVLVGLAVLVGTSMDTETQRVEWREIAQERRVRRQELEALRRERERVREERLLLEGELERLCAQAAGLCDRCPLRGFRLR
jgi:hypothetical protein